MKILFRLLTSFLVFAFSSCGENKKEQPAERPASKDSIAQVSTASFSNPYAAVDLSPMDMSYFPVDYPKLKMTKVTAGPPLARLVYSRPHLGGRELFEAILKFDEPWRLGANEATELQLFKNASIQDKKIAAGRYVLYCIPHKGSWTIVINNNIDSWGLQPDASKDVARFEVPVTLVNNRLEYFTMIFEKTESGADLLMAWDNIEVKLPFRF